MRRRGSWARTVGWLAERCGRDAFLQDLDDGRAARRDRTSEHEASRWHRSQLRRSFVPLMIQWLRVGSRRSARGLSADASTALRTVRAAPHLSLTVILVLALGIGISVAVYGAFRSVLVRPLPFSEPDRLVSVNTFDPSRDAALRGVTGPDYFEHFGALESFSDVAALESFRTVVRLGDRAERMEAAVMTRSALNVLDVQPLVGRTFSAEEDGDEASPVALISERLWRRAFDAGDVAGRSIRLDGAEFIVLGVLPDRLDLPHERVDLWVPMGREPAGYNRRAPILDVVARLAVGVSLAEARAEVAALDAELARRYPDTHAERRFLVAPLIEVIVGDQRGPLAILSMASVALLLVAAANAASLQLGRWHARGREIATRRALGATRLRLVRQLALENGILGLLACGPGLLLAHVLLRRVPGIAPPAMPRLDDLGLDPTAVPLALAVIVASAGASVAPMAVRVLRRRSGTSGTWIVGSRDARLLLIVQVAASAVLVASATALLGVSADVVGRDRGIDADQLLVARVDLPDTRYPTGMARYPDWTEVQRFHEELLGRLRDELGVAGAAVASAPPAGRVGFRSALQLDSGEDLRAVVHHVSSDWTAVVGQRLLYGRDLDDDDTAESRRVAVVNRSFATLVGGFDRVLGRSFDLYRSSWEIVGVVTDTEAVGQPGTPAVFLPFRQAPVEYMTVVVRTSADPMAVAEPLRRLVATLDPELALYDVGPLATLLAVETIETRFVAFLIGAFGLAGVLLGGAGVLASLLRSVIARRREMGVRLALGARPRHLLWGVVLQGTGLVATGLLLAMPIVVAAWGRLAAVAPEAVSLPIGRVALTALGFLLVAALASLLPARRAAHTDPRLSIQDDA